MCVYRCNLLDIEALRQAVKKEAGTLQTQLDELVCHHDESLKQVRLVVAGVFSSKHLFKQTCEHFCGTEDAAAVGRAVSLLLSAQSVCGRDTEPHPHQVRRHPVLPAATATRWRWPHHYSRGPSEKDSREPLPGSDSSQRLQPRPTLSGQLTSSTAWEAAELYVAIFLKCHLF